MKWLLEISDCPANLDFPILGTQVSKGIKKGPWQFSKDDIIAALSEESDLALDVDGLFSDEQHSPILPQGTIRYSHTTDFSRERITMTLPKKQWDIRYGDEQELFPIEFPKLILQFVLVASSNASEKAMVETRIFAIRDDEEVNDTTQLYSFPFPNVGKTNGIVCWGANQRLTFKSLTDLERAFVWFVAAPFNEDHGVKTTFPISNFRKLIEVIQDTSFNDDWLIPLNMNLGDLFKK
ncbi:prokaryotic E2 ligase family D protein [Rummeliibacillus stabekisii]|uniref:prokaryotic E2 ligase family D protein n=1 Tax=Rummeliibacillus stabekisii TaxID=241244 RepID=UPI00203D2686|nr:prokaryotic E2 ligase family D protein [Rummeliibacillus stabekisii]MCM3317949.1 prokaryotic E2 ligase family D protein [Rummeliibacillus stabekisii]